MKPLIKRMAFVFAGLAWLGLTALPSFAQPNLVTNGGFETGDLSNWTSADTFIRVNSDDPHTGTYAAYLSSNAPDKSLYQAITTTAGQTYDVSFWLTDVHVRDPLTNHFAAYFGGSAGAKDGQLLLDVTDLGPQPYTKYSYSVTATSSTTYLQFFENNVNDIFYLDDISVQEHGTSVPEASTLTLYGGTILLGSCCFLRRHLRR